MASWTFATEAAPVSGAAPVPARRAWLDAFERRGSDVVLGVSLTVVVAILLAFLPRAFSVDSWLALVTGREVWQSGLPHHETLTALAHGARWIDQQWLSQLISYGVYLVGGLALFGVVNVVLLAASMVGAVIGARRLGASARAVMLVLPFCAALIVYSREVRTQELVLPLFVATCYLLAADSRASSRRVYWCLPLLVLWANLHGTVALGALLVVLRGLTVAWERRERLLESARAWVRPLVLVLGAPLCMLATPYGLSIVSYYRETLIGGTLRQTVTEWQPITSVTVMAVLFFLLAGVTIWSFGRSPRATTLFERLAVLALAAASIQVIRNALFFALIVLLVLPVSLPAIRARGQRVRAADRGRRARINLVLATTALLAVLVQAVVIFARPASAIELNYQRTAILQTVRNQTTSNPGLKVFADVRFADWLLWRDPALAGRIANDARFELFTPSQITRLQNAVAAVGANWKQGIRGFRLVVTDRRYAPAMAAGLLREPRRRILFDDGDRLVILRAPEVAR